MKLFRYGIDIFDGSSKEYGGHWQWLYRLLGRRIDYLFITFCFQKPLYHHYWYDSQHHTISFLLFTISWGGNPLLDIPRYENEK